jgi:hypothetical protein
LLFCGVYFLQGNTGVVSNYAISFHIQSDSLLINQLTILPCIIFTTECN